MSFETIKVQQDGALASIYLSRPDVRNSINQKLRFELIDALKIAMDDPGVRVILLGGEGKGFCAGADLGEQLPGSDQVGFISEQLKTEYIPIINHIVNGPKPVVAVVNGAAAGIGMAFALACDFIIMEENAFLYSAFGSISLVPDGGLHVFLRAALGPKKAYEMIALSQKLTAKQCLDEGIANRVVPLNKLQEEAVKLGVQLCEKAPLVLQYSKQLLAESADGDLGNMLNREAEIQDIVFRSQDFVEGTSAFFEKRKAKFTGK
jgi:2-(1,2-epoxy-1,2-dihydrophenyl)acetyl-CoA isomerase